ncbi:hypothetical protein TRFO_01066 [Tritrichomonas foetus]|uniref:Uncharacterized protein n=1 Tax=Tritrichomonas foetus TaxID=1144522 RepID=A0A1J4KMY7_9EUKA|nr:hypothetical protein TRFO_01066 [Tritrichomonas foetus]|eukprot:OHT11164.1 hypothetical protein TRFO_01066 [Tritrichomonas foetus]
MFGSHNDNEPDPFVSHFLFQKEAEEDGRSQPDSIIDTGQSSDVIQTNYSLPSQFQNARIGFPKELQRPQPFHPSNPNTEINLDFNTNGANSDSPGVTSPSSNDDEWFHLSDCDFLSDNEPSNTSPNSPIIDQPTNLDQQGHQSMPLQQDIQLDLLSSSESCSEPESNQWDASSPESNSCGQRNHTHKIVALSAYEEQFRFRFYQLMGRRVFPKNCVSILHNEGVCKILNLPKASREEKRSIKLYFQHYAQFQDQIILLADEYIKTHPEFRALINQNRKKK